MFRLLSHDNCPPGEFRYDQEFNGRFKKFGPTPLMGELAARVANFRAGNKLPRATQMEALEDIDLFTCQRLGNSPRWTYNTDRSFAELVPKTSLGGCATCGQSS
jgi:hypothetical protein